MAFAKLLSTSSLAAALALLFAPVSAEAQRGNHNGWRSGDPSEHASPQSNGGGRTWWRGGENAQRQQQAAPVYAPPVQQVQRQANPSPSPDQRQWRGREGGGEWRGRGERSAQPAWTGNATPQVQVQQQAQQPRREWRGDQARTWQNQDSARRNGWQHEGRNRNIERNRTYSDPNRNRAYQNQQRSYDDNRRQTYRNDGWGNNDRRWNDNRRDNNRRGYAHDNRRWDQGWRNDRRYDWHSYRNQYRDIYRMGYYRAPYRDWSYRRLSIGFNLDALFYADSYWIADPWRYRLPEVDGPYRWVRYYDDVLLVDTYTGEVVDVIENFFW